MAAQVEDRRTRHGPALPSCSTSSPSSSRCWRSASGCCRSCSTRSSRRWRRTTTSGRWRCGRRAALMFDRNGRVLVENRSSYSISIVREHTKDLNRTIRLLAAVLGIDEARVRADRRSPPPRADLPADHDRPGRDAGAGGGGHGAAPRLRAAGHRRRAGADAAYPETMAAHLFGYVGEVNDAQVAGDDSAEERRHRRPGGDREGLQRAA